MSDKSSTSNNQTQDQNDYDRSPYPNGYRGNNYDPAKAARGRGRGNAGSNSNSSSGGARFSGNSSSGGARFSEARLNNGQQRGRQAWGNPRTFFGFNQNSGNQNRPYNVSTRGPQAQYQVWNPPPSTFPSYPAQFQTRAHIMPTAPPGFNFNQQNPSGYNALSAHDIGTAMTTMNLNANDQSQWFMDTGASSHITADPVTVADDFDLGGPRDIKSAGKALVAPDENEDRKTLKILSYNVWFAENIELRIRMRAIGDLIQLHSPDVICLQEVTPDIYAIFQRSKWWKSYKCSLSSDKAIRSSYFCMQLSKLPVKSFSVKQFSFSGMGRELCVAEVSTIGDSGTPLVVATSHLESPCPGPPKWDQMFSKERVKQANEAVDFLKKNPNAIFCGDMNWCDNLDGAFPLPDGWIDAWTELKPTNVGWTYDTKANPMLSANRKLQKRLDRFLIGLRDFKAESIRMVGTKPIPDVTYLKQKGKKDLELPVLPSDHFGLLFTMVAL